jgi:hypothetical protein
MIYLYWSLFFFTTNDDKENIYCVYRGRIFKSLNSSIQESLVFVAIIILIICFWILKILILYVGKINHH